MEKVSYKKLITLSEDNNEYLDKQYVESMDQSTKKKKESRKKKSFKKFLEDENFPNQHCFNSELATDQIVSETKRKHEYSNIFDTDESIQFESTIEPANKTKKSHKKYLPSKKLHEDESLSNLHCSNSKTATDQLVSITKRKRKHSKIFITDESLLLQHKSTDQPVQRKKSHKNKSKKNHEDESFLNQYSTDLETEIDHLVPETKIKQKHSKIFDTNESLFSQYESTDEPVKKKKKNHRNKSSKKLQEDEGFPNQHCLNLETTPDQLVSETKRMDTCYSIFDADENLHLPHDQPATKKKKSNKKKLAIIDFSKQHCSETETDQLVLETEKKHKRSKILDVEESLHLQNESTNQPVRKKKKSHKNKSSKKNDEDDGFSNQCCSNTETAIEHLVPKPKIKHKHSKIFNTDDSLLQQLESTDQPLTTKKKSHKNKSSKKIQEDESFSHQHCSKSENTPDELVLESIDQQAKIKRKSDKNKSSKKNRKDEGFSNQFCSNTENTIEHLVPETEIKHQHSKISNTDDGLLLQFESTDPPLTTKKKRHKKKSSKKIHEDEGSKNQHLSNSEPAIDQLVSDDKHKHSKELDTDESLLHNQNSEDVTGHTLCHDNVHRQGTDNDYYDGNNWTHCNSSGIIPEITYLDDYMNAENELFDYDSSNQFSQPELDFTEEPVEFNVPLLHSIESVRILSGEERENLKSNELIKTGRYSIAEDAILKRNYEDFIERFGVNDPHLLLGLGKKFRNKDVTQFLRAKHFYVRLGKDLNNRSLRNIYMRARLLFDPSRLKGRFDGKEVTYLKKAHNFVGNKWTDIGNRMYRSGNATRSAFLWHDKLVKTGEWTSEERSDLIKAIETITGITDLSKVQSDKIPWEKVAEIVPTRNFFQCRIYWLENLSWKSKENTWNKSYYSKLISILSKEYYVEDFTDIDWKGVQKCFNDLTCISTSWVFLRTKLYSLKRYVPPEHKVNYKQMLNFLCKKYGVDPPL